MYKILIDEFPKYNQLTFEQAKMLLLTTLVKETKIRVERYNTLEMHWEHVPLSKFYEKVAAV